MSIICEKKQVDESKEQITFIDLFAGAGGFSEGFLQAEDDKSFYDFLLASDINENCELTHLARYNYQLGLVTEFLRQDITESDFLNNLLDRLKGQKVDVVCGGPPCQSFSLAGKRKKFDKKDDLFSHYLEVIKRLQPKYFVMENVKGILTKEGGKISELILREIKSIIDPKEFHQLIHFINRLQKFDKKDSYLLTCYKLRLRFEQATEKKLLELRELYIKNVEKKFISFTPRVVDYKTSKTNHNISTIRHGLNLLKRGNELANLRKTIINEKSFCDLDNDLFINDFNNFLSSIEPSSIVNKIIQAFENLQLTGKFLDEAKEIILALEIFDYSFDECMDGLRILVKKSDQETEFDEILTYIRLYNIDKPIVCLASDYGVPQNRERVFFIGCRKDQKLISTIPPTVTKEEKVTVFEALADLNFIGNDDEKYDYEEVDLKAKYNGNTKKMLSLLKKRDANGAINQKGMTYAKWSKKGRLNGRFVNAKKPFYVRNFDELENILSHRVASLHNHKTSKQNEDVVRRLEVILKNGDYEQAKKELKAIGLTSEKRSYHVLKPDTQSPTMMTIADDYIHFASPRALTVREMARLQSFDDSFVFQGKRSTGGNKRKSEVPQFTLVGNAVPPLLARAIATEVLKNIMR